MSGGVASVAVVYGTGSGVSILDAVEAGNIQGNLQTYMSTTSGTTGGSVSGEAAALFTGGTKIYVNDSLNTVTNVLTKANLPTVLMDDSFSGNVDASMTQIIDIGSNPRITFKRQPATSDDPNYALTTSTTQANYIYNTTATFSKAVNFSHADSEGQNIKLFGMDFTISSSTDTNTIVLLKSAKKLDLSSDAPTAEVTVAGATYTIELISASDSAASVRVTDSTGKSDSKEINEAASKKINGITIAVTTADETNLKLSATIVAGSDKVTLEDNSAVKTGEDDSSIDGTLVDFETGNPNNLSSLTISVYAPESDMDAIKAGESFVDPLYGTFKVNFAGLNIARDSTAREAITITANSDDKMNVKFKEYRGNEKEFQWTKDIVGNVRPGVTGGPQLMIDDDNRNLTVAEMGNITRQSYVVVGNEDEGYLLKLANAKNDSSDISSNTAGDEVEFTDVMSGETLPKTIWTSDGVGSVIIGGKTYGVYLDGAAGISSESYQVHLDYPDSSGNGVVVLFPTIQTSKGAKVAFYQPTELLFNSTGIRAGNVIQYNITEIKIPDGDGYESATVVQTSPGSIAEYNSMWNITRDGATGYLNTSGYHATTMENNTLNWSVGGLKFVFTNHNLTNGGTSTSEPAGQPAMIYLADPVTGGLINQSALIVWEEKDDNSVYHANIILLETGRTGDDGLGVDTTGSGDTWSNVSSLWRTSLSSNSKVTEAADLWGSILTLDSGDSDQPLATLSYPDEQVYAQLYVAKNDATVTAGTTGSAGVTALGDVLVTDSEVASVSTKNLIVIGGSCINSAAATLLGGAYCSADFTEQTGVGSGQFLIQSFADKYTTGKIALLVAGYERDDTVNAAKYLRTQAVTTDGGTKYKGTSATSATLVTETTNSSA
ncbi:MAG: hypothetical protein AABX28_00645 [Nanoarchaeota archaeon]